MCVFGADRERAFFARLILLTISFYCDVQKPVNWWYDDLFRIRIRLGITDHQRVEIDVRNVLFLDRHLNQLRVPSDVDHLVTEQVFTFDAKQHVSVCNRRGDHYGRSLSRTERVFIDNDLEPVASITEIGRGIGRHEYVRLCFYWRQESIPFHIDALATLPRDAVVAFALGSEVKLRSAVAVRLNCLREDLVVLIPAKLQSPMTLTSRCERRKEIGSL